VFVCIANGIECGEDFRKSDVFAYNIYMNTFTLYSFRLSLLHNALHYCYDIILYIRHGLMGENIESLLRLPTEVLLFTQVNIIPWNNDNNEINRLRVRLIC